MLIIHNTEYPPTQGKTDIIYYLKYLSHYSNCNTDLLCFGNDMILSEKSRVYGIGYSFKYKFINDFYISLYSIFFILNHRKKYRTIYIVNPLILSFIPIFVGKILGKRIVFDLRTGPITENYFISKLVIFLESLSIALSDKVIFINKDIYYKRGYFGLGRKKIHETLVGFENLDEGLQKNIIIPLKESTKKKFIYIGALSERRKLDTMIGAFNKKNDTILYILGSGNNEDRLKSIAGANIVFLGACKHELVKWYIIEMDFGVSFIPKTEQYDLQPPLKTIEYLGLGIPVLATDTEGNKKFINYENGVLISNYSDVNRIISSIDKCLNRKFDSFIIKNSSENFSWKRIIFDIHIFINK